VIWLLLFLYFFWRDAFRVVLTIWLGWYAFLILAGLLISETAP